MTILRKILAVSLIIFAIFLSLATLSSLLKTIANVPNQAGEGKLGYIFGILIFGLFMAWLIFFIIKRAIRLLKRKSQNEIEEIGQS